MTSQSKTEARLGFPTTHCSNVDVEGETLAATRAARKDRQTSERQP
jgi:hypothetical protein